MRLRAQKGVTLNDSNLANQHRTILVVDDDAAEQEFIIEAFRSNGVTNPIHVVNNGREAIDYLMGKGKFADRAKYPFPTFIMTDLMMPGADGFSILEQLKKNPGWCGIMPAIVMSGSGDEDDAKRAYMLGAGSYHQKATSFSELRRQLKIVHDYWMSCTIPVVDVSSRQLTTRSRAKLGERFPHLRSGSQKRKTRAGRWEVGRKAKG